MCKTNVSPENWIFRSSHPKESCKKGVLRNFVKFTWKHLYQSLFLIKETLTQVPLTLECTGTVFHRCTSLCSTMTKTLFFLPEERLSWRTLTHFIYNDCVSYLTMHQWGYFTGFLILFLENLWQYSLNSIRFLCAFDISLIHFQMKPSKLTIVLKESYF